MLSEPSGSNTLACFFHITLPTSVACNLGLCHCLQPQERGSKLVIADQFDVAIVGGGMVGMALAGSLGKYCFLAVEGLVMPTLQIHSS